MNALKGWLYSIKYIIHITAQEQDLMLCRGVPIQCFCYQDHTKLLTYPFPEVYQYTGLLY